MLIILASFIFFYQFFLFGKIPIPADTIVGMYHPFRDIAWDNLTSGVPFKNFLITDPVRQQYVWRELAVNQWKNGKLPLWNPYSFSGTPLLANFQGATFYPLNLIFFPLPFNLAWGILVILQPILGGVFLYMYLGNLGIGRLASILGSLAFSFSGFSIAWLEWNTIGHVILWLPLGLLCVEKIIAYYSSSDPPAGLPTGTRPTGGESRSFISNSSRQARTIKIILWFLIFIISLSSSFFAGHLQIFFYSFLVIIGYTIIRILHLSKNKLKVSLLFVICFLLFALITSVQWLPTLQFILLSARDFDQGSWLKPGWFIPWQNLIQFVVPDFFGNPATGNYWGIWNYGEFIGYIGIIPLILGIYALLFRRDKKTFFFGGLAFISLIFALPTPLAKLPYQFEIPLISTSQPTRLIFITDFALSILTALGLDYFLKNKSSMVQIIKLLGIVGFIYGFLWFFVLSAGHFGIPVLEQNILIAKRNLILPTGLFLISSFSLLLATVIKRRLFLASMIYIIVAIVIFDLFRFGWKFTPFTKDEWIFPTTKIIDTLKEDKGNFRVISLDRRIMPSNFFVYYRIQDIAGYDPLYLKNYSQFIASSERNEPDLSPAAFNRIITPTNLGSFLTDLLGVKYLLSLSPIKSERLEFIASEGATYLYKNKKAFPRVFLVGEVVGVKIKQEEIEKMFMLGDKLREVAVTTESVKISPNKLSNNEFAKFDDYQSNYIKIIAKADTQRLLVLTDMYYPSWKVFVDGKEDKLIKVDFTFRGVIIPEGEHVIEFKINLV